MISFTYALLLFAAALTVVYLVILLYNRKFEVSRKRVFSDRVVRMAGVSAFVLMMLLIAVQRFWNTSVFYFLLFPVTVCLLLIALVGSSSSSEKYLILLTVLLHLIVLSIVFPFLGIIITERTPALQQLNTNGVWDPQLSLLNPYYDPFPMDLGLSYVFSEVTGLSYIDVLGAWVIWLFFLVAYDLTLFSLVKKIGGSWKAGVFAILLFAFTPPTALNPQPQWLASFFILLFMLGIVRALKDGPSVSSIVLVNLSYAVAILLHGTAAIGVIIVSVLLIVVYFGRRLGMNIAVTAMHRSFISVVSTSVYVMTLGRWVIVGGLQPVMNPLMGFIDEVWGHGGSGWIGAQYVPLYDQFASAISAYAWSVPVALAAAFLFYHVINRVQKKSLGTVVALSLCTVAAALVFGGFIGSVFTAHGNLQRYLGYAGLVLFIPAAAVAFTNISKFSSGKVLSIGLISLVLFSGIGICDPEFSPQLYSGIETVNAARSSDLIEGYTLYTILSGRTYVVTTYEIMAAFSYIVMEPELPAKVLSFGGSLKTQRIIVEQLMTTGEAVAGVTYVWSSEILSVAHNVSVNIVYNSERHVAVERAG